MQGVRPASQQLTDTACRFQISQPGLKLSGTCVAQLFRGDNSFFANFPQLFVLEFDFQGSLREVGLYLSLPGR